MRSRGWTIVGMGMLGLILAAAPRPAPADMIQTWAVSAQVTDFTATHDFSAYSGTAPLTSVTLTMTYQVGQTFAFDFTPPGASSMTITGVAGAAITDVGAGGTGLLSDTYSKSVTRLPTDSDLHPSFNSGNITRAITFTSLADLSRFIGTGPIPFAFAATGGASTTTVDGPGIGAVATSVGALITLDYVSPLVPTPEPSGLVSLALGGAGSLALRAWRGRRRAGRSAHRPRSPAGSSPGTPVSRRDGPAEIISSGEPAGG